MRPTGPAAQESGDHRANRVTEERANEALQFLGARDTPGYYGRKHLGNTLGLTADITLVLKNTQLRANGRMTRTGRERVPDSVGSGAPGLIEDIHDLALASGKLRMKRLLHRPLSQNEQVL